MDFSGSPPFCPLLRPMLPSAQVQSSVLCRTPTEQLCTHSDSNISRAVACHHPGSSHSCLKYLPSRLAPLCPKPPQKAIPTAPSALFSKSIWVWGVTITMGGATEMWGVCSEWWARVASGVPCSEIFQEAPMWGKTRI